MKRKQRSWDKEDHDNDHSPIKRAKGQGNKDEHKSSTPSSITSAEMSSFAQGKDEDRATSSSSCAITSAELNSFARDGLVVVPGVLERKTADTIAESVLTETLQIALAGEDLDALRKVVPKGRLSLLLNDIALRRKHCKDPECVWRHDRSKSLGAAAGGPLYNTRQPHVSKNNGMSNVYHNPLVRDLVLFSPRIYQAISALYAAQLAESKSGAGAGAGSGSGSGSVMAYPVFARGPDRVNVKAKGATDMPVHLDRHLFDADKPPGGGRGAYRVQAFCCLRVDESRAPERAGSLEVLAGFHRVWDLAAHFLADRLSPTDADADSKSSKSDKKQNRSTSSFHVPQQLGAAFAKTHVPALKEWLRHVVLNPKALNAQADAQQIQCILTKMQSAPGGPLTVADIDRIRWVAPIVRAGDLVCWDERLPHRNTSNKSEIEREVAYVSLFLPESGGSSGSSSGSSQVMVQQFRGQVKSGHAGTNRDNYMERQLFGATERAWTERVTWTETETSRRALGLL